MHNITIIGGSGHQCIMNIDGIEIRLSKRNNRIDITDTEKVSEVTNEMAYLFGNNKPLNALPKSGLELLGYRISKPFQRSKIRIL